MIIYNPDNESSSTTNDFKTSEEPTLRKVVKSLTDKIQLLEDEKLRAAAMQHKKVVKMKDEFE